MEGIGTTRLSSALLKMMNDYKTDIPFNPLLSLSLTFISAEYKLQAQGMLKFLGPPTKRFSQEIKHTTSTLFVYAALNVTMDYDSSFYYHDSGTLTHYGEPIITIDKPPTGVALWNSRSLPIVLDRHLMTGPLTFLTTHTKDKNTIRSNSGLTYDAFSHSPISGMDIARELCVEFADRDQQNGLPMTQPAPLTNSVSVIHGMLSEKLQY
ncbi:hypothetical protein HDU76_008422 [Blyttiomyces sp. JEL0837]|nr:hypothetical protein HDU76_008422 [Blyttiomyces sp. JEL0837]